MKTALLCSYEKDGPLLRLARVLTKSGWALTGSAGTAKFLSERGFACRDVGDIVGRPILGHRVVTLARKVYASLLAATKADFDELDKLGVKPVGLVYVTLYPLEETIANAKSTQHDVLEKTDIGGPTLLRAAAKGRRLAVSNPAQIDMVEAWLDAGSPEQGREALTTKLAAAAERRVAEYVAASADYWERQ